MQHIHITEHAPRACQYIKRLAAPERAENVNLVVSQRREVLKRSVKRLNFGRCVYVVTGLASQENQ